MRLLHRQLLRGALQVDAPEALPTLLSLQRLVLLTRGDQGEIKGEEWRGFGVGGGGRVAALAAVRLDACAVLLLPVLLPRVRVLERPDIAHITQIVAPDGSGH